MATNGSFNHQEQYSAPSSGTEQTTTSGGANNNNLTKDEVGWYFVEQYYTTLSKSPDKLHVRLSTSNVSPTSQSKNFVLTLCAFSSSTANGPSSSMVWKPK
jgi:hypothetical protein